MTSVPVILDCKVADIGDTNKLYAQAYFDEFGADAITVHPYLGSQAMTPFLEHADKGIYVPCRTSNPGADWWLVRRVQTNFDGSNRPYQRSPSSFLASAHRAETWKRASRRLRIATGKDFSSTPREASSSLRAARTLPRGLERKP